MGRGRSRLRSAGLAPCTYSRCVLPSESLNQNLQAAVCSRSIGEGFPEHGWTRPYAGGAGPTAVARHCSSIFPIDRKQALLECFLHDPAWVDVATVALSLALVADSRGLKPAPPDCTPSAGAAVLALRLSPGRIRETLAGLLEELQLAEPVLTPAPRRGCWRGPVRDGQLCQIARARHFHGKPAGLLVVARSASPCFTFR